MMKRAIFPLLVLLGCTGKNVDESFLTTHGAVLARVTCQVGSGVNRYDAVMFLDGSVLAMSGKGSQLFERGDATRTGAHIQISSECEPGMSDRVGINSGHVQLQNCNGSTGSHYYYTQEDVAVSSCAGFNQDLFDN